MRGVGLAPAHTLWGRVREAKLTPPAAPLEREPGLLWTVPEEGIVTNSIFKKNAVIFYLVIFESDVDCEKKQMKVMLVVIPDPGLFDPGPP